MGVLNTMEEMLAPYIPECRYLNDVKLNYPKAIGKFSIKKPFYCVETGHFNAVETMICFNQLYYTMLAEWFIQGKINSIGKIPLKEYKKIQANDSYLVKIEELRFKKPIDPLNINGMIKIVKSFKRNNTLFLPSEFEFSDNNSGHVAGKSLIAIVLDKII